MTYLHWTEQTITDFSDSNVSGLYSRGFVFTRLGRGMMQQTRSVRIDLSKFSLTSENRRILKKTENINTPVLEQLPIQSYDFKVGKLAKDFYDLKFGPSIMSAQKVKEMLTDIEKSNFNVLLQFSTNTGSINNIVTRDLADSQMSEQNHAVEPIQVNHVGYAICFKNASLLHYSYPFYNLDIAPKDMGLGMMIRAIEYSRIAGLKYIYLGSLQRLGDTYKLQFEGLEWFDGLDWQTDIDVAKKLLSRPNSDK